ncbi:AIR synthase related protein [Actinomadura rugatobispora]|uniref:AIR synthase related protein n=1 Tax=Actinomadura rugatobispora TaxID=1994 RepID=A0ABW1A1B0_9ACTN|nr:hypothetical protein GCM10010200_017180 [Actinomadura rugatobispora]
MELPDSLAELGEYALHAQIAAILNTSSSGRLVGDDAAILPLGDGSDPLRLIVSVDRLAQNAAPGVRARLLVTQTLSDVICTGGTPLAMLLAVQVERHTDPAEVVDLVESVEAVCREYGCHLVGGDTKEGDAFSAVGVGLGTAQASRVIRRVPVVPGDLVGVTLAGGRRWGRRWGHHLVEHFALPVGEGVRALLAASEDDIMLPVAETAALLASGVTAGLDLSDGLGASLRILATANSVGFTVLPDALDEIVDEAAVAPVAAHLGIRTRAFAMSPGYVWNNMYAVPAERAEQARAAARRAGGDFVVVARARPGPPEVRYGDDDAGALIEAASDEKFRRWAWSDRTEHWLDVMRSAKL